MSVRVAGCDPGTSSLDVVVLEGGRVVDQTRFAPEQVRCEPSCAIDWLQECGPLDLVAAPSGYGLPLVSGRDCTEEQRRLMSLVRADDAERRGVAGFSAVVESFCRSELPVVFLPGVIHLPSVPAHRKINRIDLGTPDKVCVAALALTDRPGGTFCLVELGSAFTACLVVSGGRIVDGLGGTSGALGWSSAGAWDGEVAYLLSPLSKHDLFRGGVCDIADRETAKLAFREGVVKSVSALRSATPFAEIVVSGRLCESEPELVESLTADLGAVGEVRPLPRLLDAWVKHAAQGAAVIADGLAGGQWAPLVNELGLLGASGTVLDYLAHPGRS
jgi:predicted butyrate kinase (DUF1464 family)